MHSKIRVSIIIAFILAGAFLLTLSGCAFTGSRAHKNLTYAKGNSKIGDQQLNVFEPKKPRSPKDVLIFVHGGNWNSGKKSQYNLIGRNWTKRDMVTVMIDYPLSPQANYNDMAEYTARSVKWVYEHIATFGGNPERIFLSGHSAGGHLAALVTLDNQYFEKVGVKNPVKGLILIDAAGLDMYGYLRDEKFPPDHSYLKTFTRDESIWKKASPLYYVHKNMPPMTIYQGEKTYPSIATSNEKFKKAVQEIEPRTPFEILKNKKHVAMITQFFNPWNKQYRHISDFIKSTGQEGK